MQPEILAWIEKQKPDLVEWAEDFLKETRIYEEKADQGSDEDDEAARSGDATSKSPWVRKSQLQNLLGAARTGEPVALLANFLRYQDARIKGWRQNEAATKLEKLLREKVQPRARRCPRLGTVGAEVDGGPTGEETIELRYEIEAALAAQLFGFIIREYTYRCRIAGTTP